MDVDAIAAIDDGGDGGGGGVSVAAVAAVEWCGPSFEAKRDDSGVVESGWKAIKTKMEYGQHL